MTVTYITSTNYLTWRIATANRAAEGRSRGRPFSVVEAAAFQLVNPKVWTFAIAAISAFTLSCDDYARSVGMVLIGLCQVAGISSA